MNRILSLLTVSATAIAVPMIANAQESDPGPEIAAAEHAEYGVYLTDGAAQPLYAFSADTRAQGDAASPTREAASNCTDDCTAAWPPLVAGEGQEVASDQAEIALVGRLVRADGEEQVTFNGWPLYYFARDDEAEDVAGHGVEAFGGTWSLVRPDGTLVGITVDGASDNSATSDDAESGDTAPQ